MLHTILTGITEGGLYGARKARHKQPTGPPPFMGTDNREREVTIGTV